MMRFFKSDFEERCRDNPQARAILDTKTGRVWSYSALLEAVQGTSARLRKLGVRPGDRVFSVLPNGIEHFVFFLATWWTGADYCPISPLATVEESVRFIQLTRSRIALIPETLNPSVAERLRSETESRTVLPVTLDGDVSRLAESGISSGSDAAAAGRLILFTSGTVANPKAIVIQGDHLWSSAVQWTGFHSDLTPESRFHNILPMSYLGGLFNLGLIPLAAGGSFVISETFSGLSALRFWHEVHSMGINTLWLAPTMLRCLLSLHKPSEEMSKVYRQIRFSFLGMAPITSAEKERFETAFGIPLLENYALSETTFLTSERLGQPKLRSAGAVGQILPWVDLRVGPAEGDSGIGEIEVKTPFLFEGYLDAEGEIRCPLSADGYFATGDLGTVATDQTLMIRGRSKDIIKKGGYLLLLSELEELALSSPGVAEASAVGVPHDFYGESAVVCLRLAETVSEESPVLEAVRDIFSQRLAKYKWPGEIVTVESMPRTESGKIRKAQLVKALETRAGIRASLIMK